MLRNVSRKHRNLPKGTDLEGRQDAEAGEPTPAVPISAPIGKRLAMRPPPWDKSAAEAEPGSFGHWLRRQRELREISLRDIADRTKISLRYLEAMEEDRFDLLPAPVFAKGFLREYARYVGLSPDEVVNHWLSVQPSGDDEHAADAASSTVRPFRSDAARVDPNSRDRTGFSDRSSSPGDSWVVRALVLFGAVVALALVAGAIYYTVRHSGSRRPAGVPGLSAAAPAARQPPAAVAAVPLGPPPPRRAALSPSAVEPAAPSGEPSPLDVTLDFTRDCWVEVVIDGKKWISEERVPGEALQLSAQQKIVLTLGNPSAVEAQVNGYSFDLPPGRQPIHDLVIDLDTLRALKKQHEAL